ncbi:PREDICTED: uncharacterized protein LOC106747464 [Dinoponera quadriceps]|uniref:Uncharacterized protein LOC106747464 n=1 Tax=Dinoponera quadriceps TaxID=609295 RepID=A0A6P3XPS2_DINQU|nr:PREDICTED: uncharacterized protein LOC106747464 [Dinoponera quadriceps]
MNKLCATERINSGVPDGCEKFYTLTFGNEARLKIPVKLLKSCINEMDLSLITLLINHLKEINCHMYLAWAESADRENSLLSLQRAIIIECVYFGKIVQMDGKLREDQELRTYLDRLIGLHKQPQLTLEIYSRAVGPADEFVGAAAALSRMGRLNFAICQRVAYAAAGRGLLGAFPLSEAYGFGEAVHSSAEAVFPAHGYGDYTKAQRERRLRHHDVVRTAPLLRPLSDESVRSAWLPPTDAASDVGQRSSTRAC